ncbi:peptidoglycan bridge formation glycyltransferase FemA/FemB family protein [Enterococcus sp. LJL99]
MRQLVELTDREFDKFAKKHEQGNFLQSVEMAKLLIKRGKNVFFLGMKEDSQVVGAALLFSSPLKMGQSFSIYGGPLLDYSNSQLLNDFLNEVQLFIKKHKGLLLDFSPNLVYQFRNDDGTPSLLSEVQKNVNQTIIKCNFQHDGIDSGYSNSSPKVIYTKNLNELSEKDLIKTYHSSTRAKVNKAAKSNMIIRELSREELPKFEAAMKHTATRCFFSDKGLDYYKALYDSFGEQAHFMAVEINFYDYFQQLMKKIIELQQKIDCLEKLPKYASKQKNMQNELQRLEKCLATVHDFVKNENQIEILAVGLFIERPQEMLFLFGGMYDQYKKILSSSYYLQHIMMKKTIQKGIPRYNFYGIEGVYDGSDGVLNFKKGFGGIVEERLGNYIGITQPVKYKIYRTIKKLINNS